MDYELLSSSMMSSHFEEDSNENDYSDLFDLLTSMEGPEEFLYQIRMFKDEGNSLYKKGMIKEAFFVYDKVAKLLSLGLPMCSGNCFSDLALSLNLNLAICALKLGKFRKAKTLCSLVLEFDQYNVKALYRRALAAMELGLLQDSYQDLSRAIEIEPKNQDIQDAMHKVRQSLGTSIKGKRKVEEAFNLEDGGLEFLSLERGESSNAIDKTTTIEECKSEITGIADHHGRSFKLSKGEGDNAMEMEIIGSASDCSLASPILSTKESNGGIKIPKLNFVKSKLRFGCRQRWGSFLDISGTTYKKLVEGKEISFFNPSTYSVMKIRVHNFPKSSPGESSMARSKMESSTSSSSVESCVTEEATEVLEQVEFSKSGAEVVCESETSHPLPLQVFCFKSQHTRSSRVTSSPYVNHKYLRRWRTPRSKTSQLKAHNMMKTFTHQLKHMARRPVGSMRHGLCDSLYNRVCLCRKTKLKRKSIAMGDDMVPRKRFASNLRGVASERILCYFGDPLGVGGEMSSRVEGSDGWCVEGSEGVESCESHTQSVQESSSGCSQAYSDGSTMNVS